MAQDIEIARDAGARLEKACEVAGIDARTLQRWKAQEGLTKGDGRPVALRPPPSHALSEAERAKLLSVANEPRFCAVPPARIVPMLADEGVYSRPRVSDDNAYAESLFGTAKYRPEFPTKGFETLQAAREWGAAFVHWYNLEHEHSGIRYGSPQQRHIGDDHAILAARHALYNQAKGCHPARWARHTRDWTPIGAVNLNPERDCVIAQHVAQKLIQPMAA